MSNPLLTEALARLPKGTDPATIARVTRTTDDAHPGCDLRVQLGNGSFVWLRNPDAVDPVDVQVTGDDQPRLGPAAFNTRLRQAVASGEITDVKPGEVDAKQAHELARQLGVTLTGVPDDDAEVEAPTVEEEPDGETDETEGTPGDDTDKEFDGDTFTVDGPPDELDDMTVLELRVVAKEEGVTGYGALTRNDLVAAIRQARETHHA